MEPNVNSERPSGDAPPWRLPEALDRLARGEDAGLVGEIMADFRRDGAARVALVRRAVESGDRAAVRTEAHALKGSAAQMGADRLAAACLALENAAREGSDESLEKPMDLIQTLFDEVSAAIGRHPLCRH